MKKYRIVAITQIFNEKRRGNIERFFKYLKPIVDDIVVYDDASTDGSYEIARLNTSHVIRGERNDFMHEQHHKRLLFAKAMTLHPDIILTIDADEVLTANAADELQNLAKYCEEKNLDGLSFHSINLWRSNSHCRLDNEFNDFWPMKFWRVTPKLSWAPPRTGLHQPAHPTSIKRTERTERVGMLHFGFADDDQILFKYYNYRKLGQSGWELHRFFDESSLATQKVDPGKYPPGLGHDDPPPIARSVSNWLKLLDEREELIAKPSISIISMIYKSTEWLEYCYEQMLRYTDLQNREVFFVANDPTDEVLQYLEAHYIPHTVFRTTPEQKKEWYINNVYRAYNFGIGVARGDYVLFVNSDMGFTPNWVENMSRYLVGNNCVTSQLVESGKLPSAKPGISKDFGRSIKEYDEKGFQKFASKISTDQMIPDGLFMPLLIKREDILKVGGYPAGNIIIGSDIFHPKIAKQSEPEVLSGDRVLMQKLQSIGISHTTSLASVVYHFQEGEKDSNPKAKPNPKDALIVIVNDFLTGSMGERTMWNVLIEQLPNVVGVDKTTVGKDGNFKILAQEYIRINYPKARIIIQNASFIDLINPNIHTIGILQDDLRKMGRPSKQQEKNLRLSKTLVTNSLLTANSYSEYNFNVIPLGVDHELFVPRDKQEVRKELGLNHHTIGIFVGELSDVKGWSEIHKIINKRNDVHWIIVSKYDQHFSAPNVSFFSRIPQEQLAKLLSASDFFILGSPVETQCLAAIEACLCDVPIIMHLTGIFSDFSESDRNRVGIFGGQLDLAVDKFLNAPKNFSPRSVILEQNLTISGMVEKWKKLLYHVMPVIEQQYIKAKGTPKRILIVSKIRIKLTEIISISIRTIKSVLKLILPLKVVKFLYGIVYRQ